MAVNPVGRVHTAKEYSDLRFILLATRLWSVFRNQVACFTPNQVVILAKTSGAIRASFSPSFAPGEWVHELAFSGSHVFLATNQRILVKPLRGQPLDFVLDEAFLNKPDHFFVNGRYLVIAVKERVLVWNMDDETPWNSASYPSSVEKIILFNEQLIVSCENFDIYRNPIQDLREISLLGHGLNHPKLFGDSHFYAICGNEGVVTACMSSKPNQEIHIPFRLQILDIAVEEDVCVAVNEERVMTYFLSKRSIQTIEGGKIVSGVLRDGEQIYIRYHDHVTKFNPENLEEENLFLDKKSKEIQAICQVGKSYLLKIGDETVMWPKKNKDKGCCALM